VIVFLEADFDLLVAASDLLPLLDVLLRGGRRNEVLPSALVRLLAWNKLLAGFADVRLFVSGSKCPGGCFPLQCVPVLLIVCAPAPIASFSPSGARSRPSVFERESLAAMASRSTCSRVGAWRGRAFTRSPRFRSGVGC